MNFIAIISKLVAFCNPFREKYGLVRFPCQSGTKYVIGMYLALSFKDIRTNYSQGKDVEETPTFGTRLDTDYILGMAKMEGSVKILLDIDRVLRLAFVVCKNTMSNKH